MEHKFGFTVIELMVVLAIISMLSAISMPGIIHWRQDHQLNSATRGIQAAIQRLRIQAMKEKSTVSIIFSAVTNDYEVCINMRGVEGGRTKILKYRLPPGIRFNEIKFGGVENNTLRFNSRGWPAGGFGSVSLINQRRVVTKIIVPITGNPRISL
jgi:prepilin-type N-terminal cleavage/methylation domain-containing protein